MSDNPVRVEIGHGNGPVVGSAVRLWAGDVEITDQVRRLRIIAEVGRVVTLELELISPSVVADALLATNGITTVDQDLFERLGTIENTLWSIRKQLA